MLPTAKSEAAIARFAFGVGRAEGSIRQIIHAVADEVAVLGARAVVVPRTLRAEPHRADSRLAFAVGEADVIVAEQRLGLRGFGSNPRNVDDFRAPDNKNHEHPR